MGDRAWKRTEREVARRLGGQRVPVSGRARGDAPDVTTTWAAIEVKTRKTLPAWLLDAMRQAEAAAKDGQAAVVVLHEAGQRYDDALVVMRLRDFVEWFGAVATADGGRGVEISGAALPMTARRVLRMWPQKSEFLGENMQKCEVMRRLAHKGGEIHEFLRLDKVDETGTADVQ